MPSTASRTRARRYNRRAEGLRRVLLSPRCLLHIAALAEAGGEHVTAMAEAAKGTANSHHSSGTDGGGSENAAGYLLDAGNGEHIWFSGTRMSVKAGGQQTRDGFTLIEVSTPPRFVVPPHIHDDEQEAFYA